ncbi:MAG: hypothetical protein DMD95_11495 [Candidatus Rokuibacteriota bacterium]|nr:MAG: hypothetical protein DMD95_11495 [Candidatus Rokubacteria bacterium]
MKRYFVVAAVGLLSALLAGAPVGEVAAQPRPSSPPKAEASQVKPEGEMRWAIYVTLAPQWLDPAEVLGQITPFWVLYAMHDALVKPMPGNLMTPSLAESWTVSPDQRAYEFKLREGLKFHNGDPFTAEDVKFSFHRTKGTKILKDKVREITVVDPYRVRFQLHEPFPDFMAFYGTLTTGAGWVVPKKYVEKVGDEGFKKHPIGLGPYRFVSHTLGVELVMEAFEGYWRKMPSVKRLVFKVVPDPTTRAAMLKRGEVDVAYMLDAPQALELQKDPSLRLAFSGGIGIAALDFLDMWDPKSPWADKRVRLAANFLCAGRSGHELSRGPGHQAPDAAHGARRLLRGLGSEEAEGRVRLRERTLRQRRHADVGDRAERRDLRVRRLSRHRRALQAAGPGDRPQETRGHAAPDPADPPRAREIRAHLRIQLAERDRAARGGARADADQPVSVVGASRGGAAEEEVRGAAMKLGRGYSDLGGTCTQASGQVGVVG